MIGDGEMRSFGGLYTRISMMIRIAPCSGKLFYISLFEQSFCIYKRNTYFLNITQNIITLLSLFLLQNHISCVRTCWNMKIVPNPPKNQHQFHTTKVRSFTFRKSSAFARRLPCMKMRGVIRSHGIMGGLRIWYPK